MPPNPAFRLQYWLKLGWVSFGGPATQISLMHEDLVQRDRLITEAEFQKGLSLCLLLPGPEAQQLASYLGLCLGGLRGGVLAGLSFILPGLLLMGLLAGLYQQHPNLPWMRPLTFLYPSIIALSVLALWNLARRSCRDLRGGCWVGVGSLALISQCITLPTLMLLFGGLRLLQQHLPMAHPANAPAPTTNAHTAALPSPTLTLALGFSLAYGLPLLLIYVCTPTGSAWWSLAWVSMEMATLSFGGAYVVLPLFITRAVQEYHWISLDTLVLALTLSELTPGPLVLVVCFVGSLVGAAASLPSHAILGGVAGLLLASYYLFLPSFAFILLGAPLIHSRWVQAHLEGLLTGMGNAALAGLISLLTLALTSQTLSADASPSPVELGVGCISLCLLLRWPRARFCIVLGMGLLHWGITRIA